MLECFIVFVYSALAGTFLSACITRIPSNQSVFLGRIHCPHCSVSTIYRIPIVGYLFSGGVCKKCNSNLNSQNFFVELLTATLSIPIYLEYGFSVETAFAMLLLYCLIVIAFIDYKHMVIPKQLLWFTLALGCSYTIYDFLGNFNPISSHIIGMAIISLPLLIFVLLAKGSIGMGDIKLFAAVGLFLGTKWVIIAFVISIVIAGLESVLFGNISKRSKMPFAPYISTGIYVSMLYGNELVEVVSRWSS